MQSFILPPKTHISGTLSVWFPRHRMEMVRHMAFLMSVDLSVSQSVDHSPTICAMDNWRMPNL